MPSRVLKATDQWGYFQSTGVKLILREAQLEDLQDVASGDPAALKRKTTLLERKVKETRTKKEEIQKNAREFEKTARSLEEVSEFHDRLHLLLAGGVTLFQVSIAVAAIAALTRRREYWFVGIALGTVALGFLAAALLAWGGIVGNKPEYPNPHPPRGSCRGPCPGRDSRRRRRHRIASFALISQVFCKPIL